jgi:hypothetical protein
MAALPLAVRAWNRKQEQIRREEAGAVDGPQVPSTEAP